MGLFDVKEQLSFYGAYHNNKLNQLVHIICVPLIWWSAVVFVSQFQIDLLPSLKLTSISPLLLVTPASIVVFIYAIYYTILDIGVGGSLALCMLLSWPNANWINQHRPDLVTPIFLFGWIFGWTAQILSHKFFEKRSPAFLDNLVQSILLAPLFVWYEVLFMLGYKKTLKREINSIVGKKITEWKLKKK